MEFVPLIVAAALVKKIVDGVKLLFPAIPSFGIQVVAWVTGVLVAILLRETDFAGTIGVSNLFLANVNIYTTVLFGVALGSAASFTEDTLKAVDNTRTSRPGANEPAPE